jgi:hypothetical protein
MKHREVVIAFSRKSRTDECRTRRRVSCFCGVQLGRCRTLLPSKLLATHKKDTGWTNEAARYVNGIDGLFSLMYRPMRLPSAYLDNEVGLQSLFRVVLREEVVVVNGRNCSSANSACLLLLGVSATRGQDNSRERDC